MEFLLGLLGLAVVLAPLALALFNMTRMSALTRRVQQLELSLLQLRGELSQRPAPREAPPTVVVQAPAPKVTPAPAPPSVTTEPAFLSPAPASQPGRPQFAMPLPPKKSRSNKEWEALIGGKVLNRIGALALIIGVGFFLKYAFDNNWISETLRVVMGGIAGAGLLVAADRFKKKGFEIFSQGLVGAGIAILYLSIYAAFNFYQLVPQVIAFAMMSGVTLVTLWLAFRYDSLAVALLGWAGGFLTPFMLSTGTPNQIGLFTYLALLDAALLTIVLAKEKWYVLEPLTLFGTSLLYSFWFVDLFKVDAFVPTLFFLLVFWILFVGAEVIRMQKGSLYALRWRHIVSVIVGLLFLAGMYELFDASRKWLTGIVIALIAFPYGAMFARVKASSPQTAERSLLLALGFIFSATAIQFSGFTTVTLWGVEAGLVVWAGAKILKTRSMWLAGTAMLVVAFFKLMFSYGTWGYQPLEDFVLLFNIRTPAFLLLGGGLFVTAELLRDVEDRTAAMIARGAAYAAAMVGFAFVTVEVTDWFEKSQLYVEGDSWQWYEYRHVLTTGVVWMFYSVALLFAGIQRRLNPLRYSSLVPATLALLVGVFVGFEFVPISWFTPVVNYRIGALGIMVAGAVALLLMWRGIRPVTKSLSVITAIVRLAILALLLVIVTSEIRDYFGREIYRLSVVEWTKDIGARIDQLENMKQLLLSGAWIGFSIGGMAIGLWRRIRNLRLVAIGLFGFTILKIFIYDLSFLETLYRIFSFMGLGVILLGVSYIYQKYKGIILEGEDAAPAAEGNADSMNK